MIESSMWAVVVPRVRSGDLSAGALSQNLVDIPDGVERPLGLPTTSVPQRPFSIQT
jgi:hypothetical protein